MTRRNFKIRIYSIIGFFVALGILVCVKLVQEIRAQQPAAETVAKSARKAQRRLTNEMSQARQLAPMEAEVSRFMGKWSIKGMQLAVVRNDSLLYAKGFGMADVEAGKKMEPSNIMRLASASKLVTAIAVMRLVEQGKLSLDSKVFGPDGILNDDSFTQAMSNPEAMQSITVDHLLQHRGGFGLGAGDPMFNTRDIIEAKHLSGPPSDDELVRIVLGRRLAFSPGQGRRYSNFGYKLLSMVIAKVSGRSYWDYVIEEVLRPAGATGFKPATNYYAQRHPEEVRYYGPDDELVEEYNGSHRMVERVYGGSDVNNLQGAGGWLASAADLARLVASADGDPRLPDVISPTSVASLTERNGDEKQCRGWVDCSQEGRWTRTGTLSSTHALVERFPDGEIWVLLTNSGVWTGHRFNRELSRLAENLRGRHGPLFPRRNLFE